METPTEIKNLSKLKYINPWTLKWRLENGWDYDKAVSTPVRRKITRVLSAKKPDCYYTHVVAGRINESKEIDYKNVHDFFNPEVGEGSDLDLNDCFERVNALKRSFNRMHSGKQINHDY